MHCMGTLVDGGLLLNLAADFRLRTTIWLWGSCFGA